MSSEANDNPLPPQARRGIRGRYAVLATLSLFIIIPAISIPVGLMLTGGARTLELDYNERASWFMMPVKPRPLEYDKFVAGETGRQYRRTDLILAAEVEQVLQACVRLAQSEDFFASADTRDQLADYAADEANGFYPAYLLASWYQFNGDDAAFLRWISLAYDRAQGALAQRLIDKQGEPVGGYRVGPVAIGYDRVIDGQRNATLVLVYPAPISEDTGYVYLPTYRSIYRLTDPALPAGVDPGIHPIRLTFLPQPAQGEQPNWFAVPDGAVGQLPDAVIE